MIIFQQYIQQQKSTQIAYSSVKDQISHRLADLPTPTHFVFTQLRLSRRGCAFYSILFRCQQLISFNFNYSQSLPTPPTTHSLRSALRRWQAAHSTDLIRRVNRFFRTALTPPPTQTKLASYCFLSAFYPSARHRGAHYRDFPGGVKP